MQKPQTHTPAAWQRRQSERGAALISTLLISMMLLTAGGALILTTTMSATNAYDSTSEMQAYYAAEAGLQASLNVIRRGKGGNSLSLSEAKAAPTLQTNGTITQGLTYSNGKVTLGNGENFSITVTDPDNRSTPNRLLITSDGFGPRGANKQLKLMIKSSSFDIVPPATITVRGADNGAATNFSLGDSSIKHFSGVDNANPSATPKPAFAVTNADTRLAANSIAGGITIDAGSPKLGVLPIDTTLNPSASSANAPPASPVTPTPPNVTGVPAFLQTADQARALVSALKAIAQSQSRYFSSWSGASGTTSTPAFTFVDGNATIDGGAGLIVVTGNVIFHENSSFRGLILALGNGSLSREGGGPSSFYGGITVARFGATGGFLAPTYSTESDQGNVVSMQYDSAAISSALALTGIGVMGVVEK
jgi:hypothetical protein